jgi:hypothetical protein
LFQKPPTIKNLNPKTSTIETLKTPNPKHQNLNLELLNLKIEPLKPLQNHKILNFKKHKFNPKPLKTIDF